MSGNEDLIAAINKVIYVLDGVISNNRNQYQPYYGEMSGKLREAKKHLEAASKQPPKGV